MNVLHSINIFNSETCKLPYSKECIGAYRIMFIVALILFGYFLFMKKMYGGDKIAENDMMNKKVFECDVFENCCSMWPISHFIFFLILGFLYPGCAVPILTLGVGWEFIEMFAGWMMSGGLQPMRKECGDIEYSKSWWAGSAKDIVFNTAGFFVGVMISGLMRRK